jgi:lipopolysaccharide heptosyltransferase I
MTDASSGPASEQRVLMIRPSALGDVARTVPVLVSLRQAMPDARIDWLVRDSFVDAIRCHPMLDHAVPFARRRFDSFWFNPAVARELLGYLRELRHRKYQTVYDFQGLHRSGWLTWASGADRRVGFADARELAWLGYNVRHRVDADQHTVDHMLSLLEADGITARRDLRLYVPGEADQWAAEQRHDLGLAEQRYAVIAPTAAWLSKCWPSSRFSQLAGRLKRLEIDAAVVVGSSGERRQVADLLNGSCPIRLIDRMGKTNVGQLMALIRHAAVVLCNDSAALHIAVGLGVRAVAIFGPTDPAKVGPYRYDIAVVRPQGLDPVRYRAGKLGQELIARVSVEDAWRGVQRVMQAPPPKTVFDP